MELPNPAEIQGKTEHPRSGTLALEESDYFFRESQRAAGIGSYKMDFAAGVWESSAVLDTIFGIDGAYRRDVQGWLGLIHPDDQASMGQYLQDEVLAGRKPFAREYRIIRRKDGAIRWVNGLGEITFDDDGQVLSLIGTIQDITERKRAEAALGESEQRYRAQFSLASEGIITHSPEGELLEVNEAFARMHGYSPEEMVHMHLKDIDRPASTERVEERLGRILAGEALTFEVEHVHRDGTVLPLEVSASSVSSGGKSVILAFHRDISERRRAEAERAALQNQLQQAQKMESLGSLAGGVAHDMNNVLGAILAIASVNLETQPAGSPAFRGFETISRAAIRGGNTVKGLLRFARQGPMEELELDLNGLLREEVRLLEHTTLATVRLELDLAPDLGRIRGDGSALAHAFMNLCINALDAMAETGTLTLATRQVDGQWIEVRVEDDGCGMPGEVLAKAMDPFFTTKPMGKGTGLGLSMVYSIVKAHQGRLVISSEPGRGTQVRMLFPVCAGSRRMAEPQGDSLPVPGTGALKVLLIDDDELIQSSLRELLEVLGHTAIQALSGEAALALLEAGCQPDGVILDMNMPGLGGAGTLPRLRAARPEVPVLLSTGRSDDAALDLVKAHPRVALLSKPFTLRELQQRLGAW
jgi:PAS domain S-box-containing protein